MSKTVDLQIGKSRFLIETLRKRPEAMAKLCISNEELDSMSKDLEALSAAGKECDEMRERLSVKMRNTNALLSIVKEKFAEKKRLVKMNYVKEDWLLYGVQDKR